MTWRDDLDWSNGARVSPIWDAAYGALFPKSRIERPVADLTMQRRGIDARIWTGTDHQQTIDEKTRRVNYGDIALEYVHVYASGGESAGWMNLDLSIDWLGYAVPSVAGGVGCVTFIPWAPLRRAWGKLRTEWIGLAERSEAGFQLVKSGRNNNGYMTYSVAVPRRVLLDSVRDSMMVEITQAMIGGAR